MSPAQQQSERLAEVPNKTFKISAEHAFIEDKRFQLRSSEAHCIHFIAGIRPAQISVHSHQSAEHHVLARSKACKTVARARRETLCHSVDWRQQTGLRLLINRGLGFW